MAGTRTTFLNVVSYADSVVANGSGGTGLISLADLATQMSAEGSIASRIDAVEAIAALASFSQVAGSLAGLSNSMPSGSLGLVMSPEAEGGVYRFNGASWDWIADIPAVLTESTVAERAETAAAAAALSREEAAESEAKSAASEVNSANSEANAAGFSGAASLQAGIATSAAQVAGAPIYPDTASGVSGVAEGEPFLVPDENGLAIYIKTGGAAASSGRLGEFLFDDVATLFSFNGNIPVGRYVRTRSEGFSYEAVSSGGHVTTAGGVELSVVAAGGVYNFAAFGAVADYSGTPQYDGLDGTRITATDNHVAWINFITAVATTEYDGYIPSGHYGIKTPHAYGSEIDATFPVNVRGPKDAIIDFIYEDQTGLVYTTDSAAHMLLRMISTSGENFTWDGPKIKATTFIGPIAPVGSDSQVQYHGKVFGVKLDGFSRVQHRNCGADRFAFKGWNVVNSASWDIINCTGFYNIGSGFWGAVIDRMTVDGGEFAYNGLDGYPLTGYGVSAQLSVEDFTVRNGYYHHNYRKGVDSHGCKNATIQNNVFRANIVTDIGLPIQGGTVYSGGAVAITENEFHRGDDSADLTWMQTRYANATANGYTTFGGTVLNCAQSGAWSGTFDHLEFSRNRVYGGYRGGDQMDDAAAALVRTDGDNTTCVYKDNVMSLPQMVLTSTTNDEYMRTVLAVPNEAGLSHVISGNEIDVDWESAHTVSSTTYYGSILGTSSGAVLDFSNNRIKMQDHWLFSLSPVSTTLSWTSDHRLAMSNNVIVADRQDMSNGVSNRWFGRSDYLDDERDTFENNTFIVGGVYHKMSGFPNMTHQVKGFRSPLGMSWTSGQQVGVIVVDKQDRTNLDIRAFTTGRQPTVEYAFASASSGGTKSGTNALLTFSEDYSYVDTDGVTKLGIVMTAATAISAATLVVYTELWCRTGSFGVEKVTFTAP